MTIEEIRVQIWDTVLKAVVTHGTNTPEILAESLTKAQEIIEGWNPRTSNLSETKTKIVAAPDWLLNKPVTLRPNRDSASIATDCPREQSNP